ncbi:MAG: hypothetical protein EGR81_08040 [Ruminococcaceae bacterium]|nr:hypothetical protein [Oscillospiraceae bacterium]MBD8962187.1 hypothetical protein [Oscillospiraceae bacterium]
MAIQEYKSEINELQKIQLSMLKDFDAVCQRHRISYQLFSGTALGAVRHKGFIPWDDDIDVVVLREDYKRFFDSASKELDSNKYYVQREFSEHWPMFFSKLRLNGTTYIEKYHSHDARIHQGIYIDIFPCDNMSDSRLMQKLQYFASKIVIVKSLYTRGYETNSTVKKCFMQFCRILPTEPFKRLCIRRNDSSSLKVHTFFGGGAQYGSCEDTIFLSDCLKKGLKIYAVPYALAEIDQDAASTWFSGYNEKYFYDKGALYRRLHPALWLIFMLRFLIKTCRKPENSIAFLDAMKYMTYGATRFVSEE